MTLSTFGKAVNKVLGRDVGVYAILPNVFDVLYEEFLNVKHQNWDSGLSIAEQLYTPAGSQSVIISEAIHSEFKGISLDKDEVLNLNFLQESGSYRHR